MRAPQGGMLYRLNDAWQFRSRVATGYGTPQISNLTVTAQGVSGTTRSSRRKPMSASMLGRIGRRTPP